MSSYLIGLLIIVSFTFISPTVSSSLCHLSHLLGSSTWEDLPGVFQLLLSLYTSVRRGAGKIRHLWGLDLAPSVTQWAEPHPAPAGEVGEATGAFPASWRALPQGVGVAPGKPRSCDLVGADVRVPDFVRATGKGGPVGAQ